MSIKKNNKTFDHTLDGMTIRKMKYIIVLCVVACLFCEFVPEIISICKFFNYNKIVVFLWRHKDFFTNIALGCLGSAIISYVLIYMQVRIKKEEKEEKLELCFINIMSEYLKIFFTSKEIDIIAQRIRKSNSIIRENINSFSYYKF